MQRQTHDERIDTWWEDIYAAYQKKMLLRNYVLEAWTMSETRPEQMNNKIREKCSALEHPEIGYTICTVSSPRKYLDSIKIIYFIHHYLSK